MIRRQIWRTYRVRLLCPWSRFCGELGSGGRIYACGERMAESAKSGTPGGKKCDSQKLERGK